MCCIAALGAAPAWGAFTARGGGTSPASVAVLQGPATVSATVTPGDTTVHVAWSTVAAPVGAVDGYSSSA